MKIKVKIVLTGLFVVLFCAYYFQAYFSPKQQEKLFLSKMHQVLVKENNEFELKEVTDFEWDNVDIYISVDSDWEKKSPLYEIVKSKGYKFNYWKDIFYWPRFGKNEYETALIFTYKNKLVKVTRLDVKELKVMDTIYSFDPIIRKYIGNTLIVKPNNIKEAHPLTKKLGVLYEGKITFYKPDK